MNRSANSAEIKKAYFKLAKKYHPDAFQSASDDEKTKAKERFVEIQNAYEILSDENKRKAYDQFGYAASEAGSGPQGTLISFSTRFH